MTKYLLSIYQPTGAEVPTREFLDKVMHDVEVLRQEMRDAGVWVFSGGLHAPSTATVLQLKDTDVLMTDGPFVEGKEYLGGFTIIEAPDLDAALGWGRKLATAIPLAIEVRPFVDEG